MTKLENKLPRKGTINWLGSCSAYNEVISPIEYDYDYAEEQKTRWKNVRWIEIGSFHNSSSEGTCKGIIPIIILKRYSGSCCRPINSAVFE